MTSPNRCNNQDTLMGKSSVFFSSSSSVSGIGRKHCFNMKTMSPSQQFSLITFAMFSCFGIHNLLQEAIMSIPGFTYGIMLAYLEVLGVTVCSYVERTYIRKEKGRKAPLASYSLLTMCLMTSSGCSNMSLNYINFPTKVMFRSSKLIPTMILATIINRHIFKSIEYACAFAISLGLIIFTVADWHLAPSFHPIGLVLVSVSVFADAVLPNAQEKLFHLGSSRLEVTIYTNFFTLIVMTFSTVLSGDFMNVMRLACTNSTLTLYMIIYTSISYVAVSTFMIIVKKYGGVTAVLLGTSRKAMTLILSFVFFPKAFSVYYVIGACLVLGGLLVGSLAKQWSKKKTKNKYSATRTCTSTSANKKCSPLKAKDSSIRLHDDDVEVENNDNERPLIVKQEHSSIDVEMAEQSATQKYNNDQSCR
mmetsp:Transcript_26940/g.31337  ORF Transcript_26940/g.31337 Transcript_26940/m.31337 type:complete len:419 (-) Transcript_26940:181-1437(-)